MNSLPHDFTTRTPGDAPICAIPIDRNSDESLALKLADMVFPQPKAGERDIASALRAVWAEEFLATIRQHAAPPTESDWHDAEDWYTDGSLRVGQKLRWKSTSGHIFVGTREQADRVFFGLPGDERLAEYAYLAGGVL